ncbi:MAG TPA: hypothetical protein DIU00_01930 [Phycisphaerales bacterium]|nr:hypothetical protein [Phycisphaerales bacterium]
MSVYSGTNRITQILCIAIVACAVTTLAGLTSAENVTGGPGKLAFTENEDGGYEFDTGILRGGLRRAGKGLGLTSAVHLPTGTTLNGAYGILSYYRVFTTNKRYGTAAWSWPDTSKLLPNGAVQVTWPEADDRPFEMVALYRFHDDSTLDVETIVKAGEDLSKFEVFLASYFHESFPLTKVFVTPDPKIVGKRTFLTAKKSFGNWQMFPRDYDVMPIIRDGRWQKQPNPVDWKIMPPMAKPIALRRGSKEAPTAILMAPSDDCFAISTPYEGEGHYSTYFSLFGCDIKAGQTARARLRLVVIEVVSNREILNLYEKYMKDLSELTVQSGNP